MSEIINRKFKCTGCGEGRPCYLETSQEKGVIAFYDHTEDLKCVLDETNQTSFNWVEVEANDSKTSSSNCNIPHVSHRAWSVDEIVEELKDIDAFDAAKYFFDKYSG